MFQYQGNCYIPSTSRQSWLWRHRHCDTAPNPTGLGLPGAADCTDWHKMRNNCDINGDSGFKSDYTAENRGVMGARIGVTSCSKCKYHSIGTQVTQPALGACKPPNQPYITKLALWKQQQISRTRPMSYPRTQPLPTAEPTHSAPPHSQTHPPTQPFPTDTFLLFGYVDLGCETKYLMTLLKICICILQFVAISRSLLSALPSFLRILVNVFKTRVECCGWTNCNIFHLRYSHTTSKKIPQNNFTWKMRFRQLVFSINWVTLLNF